jgi:outer membrane lipase/esterase
MNRSRRQAPLRNLQIYLAHCAKRRRRAAARKLAINGRVDPCRQPREITMRAGALLANIAALALLSQPAAARSLWVFGDSNVDTGWFKVSPFSGNTKFDPDLAMSSTFGIGEPTNNPGPMSVEVLAKALGTTALPANQGGTNFAVSGAKNVNVNTPANGGFPNAVPTATQISNFLLGNTVGGADLIVVNSGANDISFALGSLSGFTVPQQNAYIASQATALAVAIKSLQLHGATHIIVAGQPENFGDASFQAARQFYDTTLRNALTGQQVLLAWGNLNQVRKDIIANPATFGITLFNSTADQTACPLPSAVLNIATAWALLCSANSPVTKPTAFANQALFADDQHWSAAAQKVLGSYYNCLARFTWPQLVPSPLPLPLPPSCRVFTEFKSKTTP